MLGVLLVEPEATMVRVAHTKELMETFRGYSEKMPQHREYYESVVTHLEVILEGYMAYLEKTTCRPTLN